MRRGKAAKALGLIALLPAAFLFYAVLVEPNRVIVRVIHIPSERLARFFDDAVVVHLSDLHTAGIGLRERRLLRELARLDPDYVFVTGDYVCDEAPVLPALDLIGRISAREGIYGVLGNVDYSGSRSSCLLCHTEGPGGPLRGADPIRILRNERLVLERGEKKLLLAGLDEFGRVPGDVDPAALFGRPDLSLPRIVLAHTAARIDEAAEAGVDLYLAGDTHGGQVAAPVAILRKIVPEKIWQYRAGLFRVGPTWLHVHHGIGWSIAPIRAGYPPMIAVLRFDEEAE